MNEKMGYLKERIKHALRFRHKRGFGVHSPFMFHLIMNVIRDKEKQFAYPEVLENMEALTYREKKVFRLLSRLIRYLKVRRIVCLGYNADKLVLYLSQAYPDAVIAGNEPEQLKSADFVYIGRKAAGILPGNMEFIEKMNTPHYLAIADIYKDATNGRIWRQCRGQATVSVDMMWYGVLFFNDKIQKGKYSLII